MKSYRLFLLSFVTVTYVFLSGFKVAYENLPATGQQRTKLKLSLVEVKDTGVDSKDELQRPLNLSVPFKDVENKDLKIEQHVQEQSSETNIFAPDSKKKPQQLQLGGQLLKSPDPEIEKQKSVDGAGIVINLKP